MGIEPTYSAWKAEVLPLNYTRKTSLIFPYKIKHPPATKSSLNFATSHSIWWRGRIIPGILPSTLRVRLRLIKIVPDNFVEPLIGSNPPI